MLDYDSLASLSTVSRIETVEAFDKLSLRLSSTGSSAKRRSSAAPSSTRSKTGNRKVSSGTASTSSPGRRRRDTSNKSGSDAGRRGRVSAKTDDHATKADRSKESYYVSAETWLPLTASEHRRQNPLPMQRNRDSIRSVSSASTRLGDLSRYGSSRQSFSSGDPNEYNVPVTYPLYPHYRPYEATPKRRFWHIFRSGSS